MLYFRSEEHVDEWCRLWSMPHGATMSLETCWRLAQAWYGTPRTEPDWRRRTPDEVRQLFADLGLTSDFWRLA